MVPDWLRDRVEAYVPPDVPWGTTKIVLGRVPHAANAMTHAYTGAKDGLVAIGASLGDTVTLDPEFAGDLQSNPTAAGLGLVVHELTHQAQAARMGEARFREVYSRLSAVTPHNDPTLNPLEHAAYAEERRAYCQFVAMGYPPGDWKPLGVTLWGCN